MEVRHSLEADVFDKRDTAITRGFLARNYSIALHDHDFYEINIILSGSGIHRIEDHSFGVKAGDVFVIPPDTIHGYESRADGFNVYHLIAKEGFFTRFAEQLHALSGFLLLFEIEPYVRRQNMRAILTLTQSELSFISGLLGLYDTLRYDESGDADAVRASHTLTLIGYLSRLMTDTARLSATDEDSDKRAIMKAMEYARANLQEKLSIDRLASVALMSRATFIRRFSSVCNMSPHRYIIKCRLEEAGRLISLGKPRALVASLCGFFDVSHMERSARNFYKQNLDQKQII